MSSKPLSGKIAVVAGATRGAGRGIATALGEAGATVYCTGRSTRDHPATAGRPETIEETAEIVTARGGRGIPVRVDHTVAVEVEALAERIKRETGGIDILVNDVWGGDDLTAWGKPLWEHSLDDGLLMLQRGINSHIITSRYLGPLLFDRPNALLVEVTDGVGPSYRGNLYYDLVKSSVIRLAVALGYEMRSRGVTAVAVSPGFLRSERMLALFGVTEATWRDHITRDPHWAESETPLFVGRGIAALAADPDHWTDNGKALASWDLGERYGLEDADGRRPHWGNHIEAAMDDAWTDLVATATRTLAACAPGVELASDRKTLTLSAGRAKREVLAPELFFSKPETIAAELCAMYARPANRETSGVS